MRWLVLAVVAGGWVYAGWTNLPRAEQPYPATMGLAVAVTCLCCWLVGRGSGKASAFASAQARAEAWAAAQSTSTATATNAVFVQVGDGARMRSAAQLGGLDTAPWIGEPLGLLEQDIAEQSAEDVLGEYVSREAYESR